MKKRRVLLESADRAIYAAVFVVLVFAFESAMSPPVEISEDQPLPSPRIGLLFEFLVGKAEAFTFFKKEEVPAWVNLGPVYEGREKVYSVGSSDLSKVGDHNTARSLSLSSAKENLERNIVERACSGKIGAEKFPPVVISLPSTEESYILKGDYYVLVSVPKDYFNDAVEDTVERCVPSTGFRVVEISSSREI